MTSYVAHTTIDCADAYALSEWWKPVLGYTDLPDDPNEPGHEECMIVDPSSGHRLLFIEVPDAKQVKNRLHLDLRPGEGTRDEELERLRGAGYAVHLATNQHRQRGQHMRTALGFDALFDESFYSWELGTKKPEATYFELALERIGAEPAQVLFVDDMEVNVEAARAVGLAAEHWHLDRGHAELEELLARHGVLP